MVVIVSQWGQVGRERVNCHRTMNIFLYLEINESEETTGAIHC